MFCVINKEKLSAYIISIATVFVLFIMASTINAEGNTIETGANVHNEIVENNTNNENIE